MFIAYENSIIQTTSIANIIYVVGDKESKIVFYGCPIDNKGELPIIDIWYFKDQKEMIHIWNNLTEILDVKFLG